MFHVTAPQDSNMKLSAPLNKLIAHPAPLTRGPYQASRNEISQRTALHRFRISRRSMMALQEHLLLRWRHFIDPSIYLIEPHFYVIEAHFYFIEPSIDPIEVHRCDRERHRGTSGSTRSEPKLATQHNTAASALTPSMFHVKQSRDVHQSERQATRARLRAPHLRWYRGLVPRCVG